MCPICDGVVPTCPACRHRQTTHLNPPIKFVDAINKIDGRELSKKTESTYSLFEKKNYLRNKF